MQIVMEQTIRSRQDLKKRISSANFNSKKIKSILTTRLTCDDIINMKTKQHQTTNDTTQRGTDNLKRKSKKLKSQAGQFKLGNQFCRGLTELIKPIKHDRNKEQTLLLKNCDKTKLIFWNKDLPITGNEKYLILSADLIIDQDSFWDKLPSDNGNFTTNTLHNSNTLTTINHNSTQAYRSRNNFNTTGQEKFLAGSTQMIPSAFQKSKNPLLASSKLTSLIKEWKNLHSRCDSEGRKLIVLWMIRKQSTYSHLMEFSQANELPLHGIFYVKRKRVNAFFDLGPIVKQIHQRFLESVINPQQINTQPRLEERKSIDLSKQMRKGRSKQLKSKQLLQTVSVSSQIKKTFDSLTNREMKPKMDSRNLQNDENSSSALNSQTCKQFELSKNTKRTFGSIVIDEKRVKSILKKTGPLSSNRGMKQGSMRINEVIQNTTNDFRMKCDVSPLMADEIKQGCSESVIKEFEISQKLINERKIYKPEIYVFEGAKCNSKGYCQVNTYHGKVPILFDFHQQRLNRVIGKMIQQKVQIQTSQDKDSVTTYFFKYEAIKQNALELINNSVKQLIMKCRPHDEFTYRTSKVQEFGQQRIKQILEELQDSMKVRQKQLGSKNTQKLFEQMQLTEQQQQMLMEKTEKKLQEIKKQVIDHTIAMKGRNYTFENGQSIYYFVGDAFKRNYNLLYDEYYRVYEKELMGSLLVKNRQKEQKEKSPQGSGKNNDYSRTTDCTLMGQHLGAGRRIVLLKLSEIQFYESLNY